MTEVVSIFAKKPAKKDSKSSDKEPDSKPQESFEEIMRKNQENARRVEQERLKNNDSVTRSYRLKKK
jgi:hypothetical protein